MLKGITMVIPFFLLFPTDDYHTEPLIFTKRFSNGHFWSQFYDFVVQLLGKKLFVVVGFLGRHIDSLQCIAIIECTFINLFHAYGECYLFQARATIECTPSNLGHAIGNLSSPIADPPIVSIS